MLTIFSKSIPDRLQHGNINETEICYNTVDPSCDILDGIWVGNKSYIFCKVTKSNNCFNQQFIPANETSVVTINARTKFVGYNRNLNLKQMFVFQEEYFAEACETLQTFQILLPASILIQDLVLSSTIKCSYWSVAFLFLSVLVLLEVFKC